MSDLDVVILAAGKGTRMYSDIPKVLHPLAGQPLLAHVITAARALAARHIVVVYDHGGESVRDRFEAPDIEFAIIPVVPQFLNETPVKVSKDLPLSVIPAPARRTHPSWGVKQILSTYVLDSVLRPRLPADAAAYIAFTASDLWPGAGWNFVFGQASLRHRVGVWSIYRNGDPSESKEAFRICLLRLLWHSKRRNTCCKPGR